jgi:hypothetical protein
VGDGRGREPNFVILNGIISKKIKNKRQFLCFICFLCGECERQRQIKLISVYGTVLLILIFIDYAWVKEGCVVEKFIRQNFIATRWVMPFIL